MPYETGLIASPHQIRARTRIPESRGSNFDFLPPSAVWNDETRLAERDDEDPKPGSTDPTTITHIQLLRASREGFYRRLIVTFLLLLSFGVLFGLFVLEDRVHAALRRSTTEDLVSSGMDFGDLAFNETRFTTRNSTKRAGLPLGRIRGKRPVGSAPAVDPDNRTEDRKSSSSPFARGTVGRFPLIDRATLAAKLGGFSGYDDDDDEKELSGLGSNDDTAGRERERTVTRRWPPMITRIPESSRPNSSKKPYPPSSPSPSLPSTPPRSIQPFLVDLADKCSSGSGSNQTNTGDSTRPPCPRRRKPKFLLPLRIAEQESKARIHFLQLVQLAHRLDRILVLPNVAKSRMGACYRWPFEVYYDLEGFSLGGEEVGGEPHEEDQTETGRNKTPRYITLENFKLWSDYHRLLANKTSIHSRLVSIASSLPKGIATSSTPFSGPAASSPFLSLSLSSSSSHLRAEFIRLDRYPTTLAPPTEFPGCFPSKFPQLSLDPTSLYIALDRQDPSSRATSSSEWEGESEFEFGEALVRGLKSAVEGNRQGRANAGLLRSSGPPGVAGDNGGVEVQEQQPMLNQARNDEAVEPEQEEEVNGDDEPDVLVVNWDLRRPIFDLSHPHEGSPPTPASSEVDDRIEAVPTTLPYSPHLRALSKLLAPHHVNDNDTPEAEAREGGDEEERERRQQPYIAIHWRMETVPLSVLEDCAYALIDTLSNLLAEIEIENELEDDFGDQPESSAEGRDGSKEQRSKTKTKVWFASDYPYPISARSRDSRALPKSGTFKTFNEKHERAIRILKSAFHSPPSSAPASLSDEAHEGEGSWEELEEGPEGGGGELAEWAELVDISSSSIQSLTSGGSSVWKNRLNLNSTTTSSGPWGDPIATSELLQDTGVLGILDKLIVMQADWFVSGSRRCSRQSSFTRQVIEARQADGRGRRNVVTLF